MNPEWRINGLDGAPLAAGSRPEIEHSRFFELLGVTITVTGNDREQENGDILHPVFKYEGVDVRIYVGKDVNSRAIHTDESYTSVKLKVGDWFTRFGRRKAHRVVAFTEAESGLKHVESQCKRSFPDEDPRWSALNRIPDPETLRDDEKCSQCSYNLIHHD